jgi:mRNA interferase MazF
MKIKQFEIWIADVNPRMGTGAGKIRPVLVVQTDLLNGEHPSTVVCPITTNINLEASILRIHLKKGMAGVKEACDIMIDQVRAIDNRRLLKKVGSLPASLEQSVKDSLMIVFDL